MLLPHEIQQSVKVVSRFRELMSVEISNAGFTGGAHPYAVILRATYSQKTGERVDLGDLYGAASAAELLKKAEKEFEKRGMSDYYRFEPASFSLAAAGASKVKITFSAPHADETYRGTTLEVSVTTAAPKIK
ncbi:MAG: hypothetical protein M5R36_17115 [Deltaproteobacteria bacterium]|nr:hypothetical protein [Deltaproteobacteria bacterium]